MGPDEEDNIRTANALWARRPHAQLIESRPSRCAAEAFPRCTVTAASAKDDQHVCQRSTYASNKASVKRYPGPFSPAHLEHY